jgi:DNA-binding transcriptional LysR family regulator
MTIAANSPPTTESLSGMVAFVRAAETGSFVAAGRALGLSASAVGKSVMRLEAKLGVQLLNRTTRRIGLTHEGARFFARCKRILSDLEEAEGELFHSTASPRPPISKATCAFVIARRQVAAWSRGALPSMTIRSR